ncbi:plastid division protein PDV2-like [Andrographis paniculata]|uniref:plastid division protein PDV2-like n=1 Tax=Andrographis paniculata TaxID=175694 RepID=UPI0021E921C5|nr:plastid division protein PDV2-like [Andrographis paniculata]
MEDDRIGLVLAKTAELRSRIVSSIRKSTDELGGKASESKELQVGTPVENREDDETESLINVKDALESIEGLLSSLQDLQQRQWCAKESALVEIEYSRKKLLNELKEYKGKDSEVIREAIAFAGETEDSSSDLILPPYPTRPHLDNVYPPALPSTDKFAQNGDTGSPHESEERGGVFKWVKAMIGAAAKTSLTVVGIVAILSLSGFELRLRRPDNRFELSQVLKVQGNGNDEKEAPHECPPGKVAVVENDEVRCVVKERVEIPFDCVDATPNVRYGLG